jgi:hypothetical protein
VLVEVALTFWNKGQEQMKLRFGSKSTTCLAVLFFVLTWLPTGANADIASVVLLKLDHDENVSPENMDIFYVSLYDVIEALDKMRVKPGGEVTIDDLALTAGCDEVDLACLRSLKEVIDADRLVYGSVMIKGKDFYMSLRIFDFRKGAFLIEIDDLRIAIEDTDLDVVVPGLLEGILYGNQGQLQLVGDETDEIIDVSVNGNRLGAATEGELFTGLPLGPVDIVVRHEDGRVFRETVVLRLKTPSVIDVAFTGGAEQTSRTSPHSLDWSSETYVSFVAAGAGFALGLAGSLWFSSIDEEVGSVCVESPVSAGGPTVLSAARPGCEDYRGRIDELQSLESQGSAALTLEAIGYSVAIAGTLLGGVFLYLNRGEVALRAGDNSTDRPTVRVGIIPVPSGLVFDLLGTF